MAIKRTACRACRHDLTFLWELGEFQLCGIFPKPEEVVPRETMGLSYCSNCSLVQMHYDYEQEQYGDHYGYRSGLNASMQDHLAELANWGLWHSGTRKHQLVVDIGGNDGTLLNSIRMPVQKMLIDPTAKKWRTEKPGIEVIAQKFSPELIDGRAKLVFSIAMFYDLPDPVRFACDVASILADEGMWILEQSYLPTMVSKNAFDTICHEHLEYYSLASLEWIMRQAGLEIVHADLTETNGGSLKIAVMHEGERTPAAAHHIRREDGRFNSRVKEQFAKMVERVDENKHALLKAISEQPTVGLGASTKGNTLLQYYGIGKDLLPCVMDVNREKHGSLTATGIPICAEFHAKTCLVLPWHFRKFMRQKYRGKLIFPLPVTEVSDG